MDVDGRATKKRHHLESCQLLLKGDQLTSPLSFLSEFLSLISHWIRFYLYIYIHINQDEILSHGYILPP